MLDVRFDNYSTDLDEVIINPMKYFDVVREPEWFNDSFVKEMIKDIDDSTAVQDEYILGYNGKAITPLHLSGGLKTLICIYKMSEKLWYGSTMGDNCCPWLEKIARRTDVKIMLRHFMDLPDSCEDILYIRGQKVTIEEYEDAFTEYATAWRRGVEDNE